MTDKKIHRVGRWGQHAEPRFGGPYPVGDGISRPWYTNRHDQFIVVGYAALAVLGGLMATGVIFPQVVTGRWDASLYRANVLAIPIPLILYAGMGALTYVFTALAAYPHADNTTIKRYGKRIIYAVVFVIPGYIVLVPLLSIVPLPSSASAAREFAGMAFLFGLFIKHATMGFRSLIVGLIYKRLGRILNRSILRQ